MPLRDRLKRPGTWLIVAATAFLGMSAHWCRDFLAIDSCLDAGYVFNYVEEVCDTKTLTHRIIPYGDRHPGIIRAGMVAALLGLVAAAIAVVAQYALGGRRE